MYFVSHKLFKFSVLSMAHVRNLGARVYRKFNVAKSFGGTYKLCAVIKSMIICY